ncbi:MAG: IS481 family transposase, partial [Deinococcota bacterium]
AYLDHYNRERPHRALNGLAPLEFLAMMQEESAPQSHMC